MNFKMQCCVLLQTLNNHGRRGKWRVRGIADGACRKDCMVSSSTASQDVQIDGLQMCSSWIQTSTGIRPHAVNSSMLDISGRVLNRELHQLACIASTSSISKVITSLTVGLGAARLDLLSEIRLLNLKSFRLKQIELNTASHVIAFLSRHENSLSSIEMSKVDVVCSLTEGSLNEVLPMEWRGILTPIRGLPQLSELLVSDLGYHNAARDLTYRIWINPRHIRGSAYTRCEEAGSCDVVICAKGAQARTKHAVDKAIDAVLQSTGKKVLQFHIGV